MTEGNRAGPFFLSVAFLGNPNGITQGAAALLGIGRAKMNWWNEFVRLVHSIEGDT